MEDNRMDNDKMNKMLKRHLIMTMFCTYFFRIFGPLFLIGITLVFVGFYKQEFFYVGGILLLTDFILSVILMIRFFRMHSEHPEFERIRQAFNEGTPADEMQKLTSEWAGDGFYRARVNVYREEASECKTVGEAFETYRKHCLAVVTGKEVFQFKTGLDKHYFFDGAKYFVISFDRMRIVGDDVEVHMYFDLLYDPEKFKTTKIRISSDDYEMAEEFFDNLEEYLKDKGLMDIPVEDTNIGTDE